MNIAFSILLNNLIIIAVILLHTSELSGLETSISDTKLKAPRLGIGISDPKPKVPQGVMLSEDQRQFFLFKHSDIIAFSRGKLTDYEDYNVDFVAWGGRPKADMDSITRYCQHVETAFQKGTRIGAKVGTKTDYGTFIRFLKVNWIDAAMKKVDNTPILTPRAESVIYKGVPAYWFCINNPLIRAALKEELQRSLDCGTAGVFMDDPRGLADSYWIGGCYCKYCEAGFKTYLMKRFSAKELSVKGIDDINNFRLLDFHRPYAHLPSFRRPLHEEFHNFLSVSSADMIHEVMHGVKSNFSNKLPIGANINPCAKYGMQLFKEVDYFFCETSMKAQSGIFGLSQAMLAYKLGNAMNKPVVIMGHGGDHHYVVENNLQGMIRCWIAEAYASGNFFPPPYKLWAKPPQKASYWYSPRYKSEFVPLYNFIKKKHDLLDDYKNLASVAIVHSYATYRKKSKNTEIALQYLYSHNIPFDILLAPSEGIESTIILKYLQRYHSVVLPPDISLTKVETEALANYKGNGGIVVDNAKKINPSLAIIVKGADNVRILPRGGNHSNTNNKYVLHLLNADYNPKVDSCRIKKKFIVSIPASLLQGKTIVSAKYSCPDSWEAKKKDNSVRNRSIIPDRELKIVKASAGYINIEIPDLDIWGLVKLIHL